MSRERVLWLEERGYMAAERMECGGYAVLTATGDVIVTDEMMDDFAVTEHFAEVVGRPPTEEQKEAVHERIRASLRAALDDAAP